MEGIEKIKEAFAGIIERLNRIVKTISKIFKPLWIKSGRWQKVQRRKMVVGTRSDAEK